MSDVLMYEKYCDVEIQDNASAPSGVYKIKAFQLPDGFWKLSYMFNNKEFMAMQSKDKAGIFKDFARAKVQIG